MDVTKMAVEKAKARKKKIIGRKREQLQGQKDKLLEKQRKIILGIERIDQRLKELVREERKPTRQELAWRALYGETPEQFLRRISDHAIMHWLPIGEIDRIGRKQNEKQ